MRTALTQRLLAIVPILAVRVARGARVAALGRSQLSREEAH